MLMLSVGACLLFALTQAGTAAKPVGRRVNRGVVHGKPPRAIKGNDRLLKRDARYVLRSLNLGVGKGGRQRCKQNAEEIHLA